MIKKNILSFLLLFTALCTFNSCEVDEDDYYFEDNLYGNIWSEWYTNNNKEDVYHEINFNPGGTGTSYYEYYKGKLLIGKEESRFTWHWDDYYPNSIFIDYLDGDYVYFGNIFIKNDQLFGVWNDKQLVFDRVW